jgi:uncharacterized protein (DUF2141 family)
MSEKKEKETDIMKAIAKLKQLAPYLLLGSAALLFSAAQLLGQAQPAPASNPATPVTPEAATTLTVHITGIRNTNGKLGVALFRDAKGFPLDPAGIFVAQHAVIDPQTLTATVVFKDLPQGTYAVAVLHDENNAGKMEFDSQGIPQEGYGISKNPDTSHGPPVFEDAKFVLDQPESTVEIKMVYWPKSTSPAKPAN